MAFALAGGELLRFAAKANEAGLELHTSFCGPFRPMTESWTWFFAQGVKWNFCLTAASFAGELGETMKKRARRNHSPAFKAKVAQ